MKTQVSRSRLIAGLALIAIGLVTLAAQFVQWDWLGLLFLPTLGVIFLVWGCVTRNVGLLIPGGILSGTGLGAFLIEHAIPGLGDEASGGVFLLSFALGWGLITLLSAIFTPRTHWWPLIPGGIMVLIGGGLVLDGAVLDLLALIGRWWPLGLIAAGLWLILRHGKAQAAEDAAS